MQSRPGYSFILAVSLIQLSAIPLFGRVNYDLPEAASSTGTVVEIPLINSDQLRHTAVHDAGDFFTPIYDGILSMYDGLDPETGEDLYYTTYPRGSGKSYIYWEALWVGGIVGDDTLVSAGVDGWFQAYELPAENPGTGGAYRTGNFADDEFITVQADTGSRITNLYGHQPLGLKVEMRSYSWADSIYDDFIILEYTVRNIGDNEINEGWIGFFFDNDVYHESYYSGGWADDLSGCLDTLLYDGDPASHILIPYTFDNDGDPTDQGEWNDASTRGVIFMILLDSDFPVIRENFNWWFPNTQPAYDFGPRRVGTPEDPYREFSQGNLGTPVLDVEKYYILSHPEIDYDHIEVAIHDSSDGWIPPAPGPAIDFAYGWDTRFLYSFGSFDLMPGDSVTFAIAVVAAEGLHTDANAWRDTFDPLLPHLFQQTLDFSQLMLHCRRADSVYRSGYRLPHPGPPVGLSVVNYDDAFVSLAWHGSMREDLAGYYVYIKDTAYSNQWNRATALLTDSAGTISVFEPTHTYLVAVSLEDNLGRESALSFPVSVLPGKPHVPENLSLVIDSITPELSWIPHADTAMQVYLIYRAIWEGPYELFDSTAALIYQDRSAESGVRYQYKVSSRNELGLESDQAGPVSALPMALDKGLLYCNRNRFHFPNPPLYPYEYYERLYESIASVVPVTYTDIEESEVTFKQMADYAYVIIDESNLPRIIPFIEDSLRNYLGGGGKAVILRSAFGNIGVSKKTHVFGPGSFSHDFLKLDSAVTNAFVFEGSSLTGDLYACEQLDPNYPALYADEAKLAVAFLPVSGYIPLAGYLYATEEAESIYRYLSVNPDTSHHLAVNGIRYVDENYGFVLMSFPLAAMTEQNNFIALREALIDLGVDMNCGDVNSDGKVNIGDAISVIAYLYKGGPPPADSFHSDVNCSGELETADAIAIINYIFKYGHISCCL